jgi:hypothetical protein
MNRTVGEHIRELEDRVKQLNEDIMRNELTLAKRNEIDAEIRVAEIVLSHYRSAIELGLQLSRATGSEEDLG